MTTIRDLRAKFRGREFWKGLNRFIGIGIYTVLILGVLLFPMYLGYVMFGFAVIIPSYITFFINHLRKMEKRGKGNKVVEGWITHAYGVGERVYFYPIDFGLVDRLSPDDLKSVKKYVKTLSETSKNIKDIGLGRFKINQIEQKQTTQEDTIKIDEMNEIERKNFIDKELDEHKKHVADFEVMKKNISEKDKIITLEEGEFTE